jgi:hypothetical protein
VTNLERSTDTTGWGVSRKLEFWRSQFDSCLLQEKVVTTGPGSG